jgi:hypothetical protein
MLEYVTVDAPLHVISDLAQSRLPPPSSSRHCSSQPRALLRALPPPMPDQPWMPLPTHGPTLSSVVGPHARPSSVRHRHPCPAGPRTSSLMHNLALSSAAGPRVRPSSERRRRPWPRALLCMLPPPMAGPAPWTPPTAARAPSKQV